MFTVGFSDIQYPDIYVYILLLIVTSDFDGNKPYS